jgi:hypothetical protein
MRWIAEIDDRVGFAILIEFNCEMALVAVK